MDKVFGLSMNTIMVVFIVLLAICLSVTLYIALRHRVIFKMGMRNIPRRKAQTALIVIGLMLSTLISTAALGMGDTIDSSIRNNAFGTLGQVDELVFPSSEYDGNVDALGNQTMPESTIQTVRQALDGKNLTDGILPMLFQSVPSIDTANNFSTPSVSLVGLDPSAVADFGSLKATNGDSVDFSALGQNQVVISQGLADKIDAKTGDPLTIYVNNQPVQLTVAAVAENSPLSGVVNSTSPLGMSMPLAAVQQLTGKTDQINVIAISNVGDQQQAIDNSDRVSDTLRPALESQGIGVEKIKQELNNLSSAVSSGLTGLFLVLGLFSIAVGVLLIILIFSMLAAERRPEMGMARAVGQQRRHLVQQFIAEGSGYALLSGLVGVAVGTLVILGLAEVLKGAIGDVFKISPAVTARSIIVGYCLGVIMTFLAIVVASFRASQLNVVAAIRDLPDVSDPKRKRRTLVTASLMIIISVLLIASAYSSSSGQTFMFYFGMSLLPFGIASLGRWLGVPARPLYSLVGIYLLVLWFLPSGTSEKLFGSVTTGGGFEMFFLIGVFAVAGATILIVQNLDLLLKAISAIGTLFGSRLPAVKLAIAYPGANVGRTGLTIAMFSLIVFSLVAFATISYNFSRIFISDKAAAGWDIQVQVPGTNPIPNGDLVAALNAAGANTSDITAVGRVSLLSPGAMVQQTSTDDPRVSVPGEQGSEQVSSLDPAFLQTAELDFQGKAAGYDSNEAIVNALVNDPDVAVIDTGSLQNQGGGFGGGGPAVFQLMGLKPQSDGFQPVEVTIQGADGQPHTVRVIGIINQDVSMLTGLFVGQTTGQQLFPDPVMVNYNVALSDPGKADARAREIGSALLQNGANADSYKHILEQSQGIFSGFLLLIQGFMGLGLIVGIAAVGVIAYRSVIERRQQIGILRAIGYARSMVSLSFLIETIFVVGLGVISGTILAMVTAWQLFQDPEFTGSTGATGIAIPWMTLIVVLVITFGFAMLMTWVPSRQAARVMPAQALRYE